MHRAGAGGNDQYTTAVFVDQAAAAQHIRHGYNGVLAMPGDEEAFCDAASWMLEQAETLRCIRLNARQHASRQGWAAIVEQFEEHLQQARVQA